MCAQLQEDSKNSKLGEYCHNVKLLTHICRKCVDKGACSKGRGQNKEGKVLAKRMQKYHAHVIKRQYFLNNMDSVQEELRKRRDEYESALDRRARIPGLGWFGMQELYILIVQGGPEGDSNSLQKQIEGFRVENESLKHQLETGLSEVCVLSDKLKETKLMQVCYATWSAE
jgi:hypothetical protein